MKSLTLIVALLLCPAFLAATQPKTKADVKPIMPVSIEIIKRTPVPVANIKGLKEYANSYRL